MKPFVSSTTFRSKWGGFRVTYFDADRNPLVSLWDASAAPHMKARHYIEAEPVDVDPIIQAALWRGKKARA